MISEPGDASTQILDHLQADVGVLQYQMLKALLVKPAGERLFHAVSTQRVVDILAEHILAEKIPSLGASPPQIPHLDIAVHLLSIALLRLSGPFLTATRNGFCSKRYIEANFEL